MNITEDNKYNPYIEDMIQVGVINKSDNELPKYETLGAAGLDVRANIEVDMIVLQPLQREIVPTGLYPEIPQGYEIQVRPRSGLAAKHGVTVLNAPGTIDSDYRGQIGVILVNLSDTPFVINKGERIAQLVLAKVEQLIWREQEELSETDRGEGAYNSTGTK